MNKEEENALQLLQDKKGRLSNLYYIKDKSGEQVLFKPNGAQLELLKPHYLNIILKARACALSLTRGGTSHQLTTRCYYFPRIVISRYLSIQS